MENLAGNFVSIITMKEERIEGILHEVDLTNRRIAVNNARNYGSEGRRIQDPQIPPSLHIEPTRRLRERDIKDLELIYLQPKEREFPSLPQQIRQQPKTNPQQRPSFVGMVTKKIFMIHF